LRFPVGRQNGYAHKPEYLAAVSSASAVDGVSRDAYLRHVGFFNYKDGKPCDV